MERIAHLLASAVANQELCSDHLIFCDGHKYRFLYESNNNEVSMLHVDWLLFQSHRCLQGQQKTEFRRLACSGPGTWPWLSHAVLNSIVVCLTFGFPIPYISIYVSSVENQGCSGMRPIGFYRHDAPYTSCTVVTSPIFFAGITPSVSRCHLQVC